MKLTVKFLSWLAGHLLELYWDAKRKSLQERLFYWLLAGVTEPLNAIYKANGWGKYYLEYPAFDIDPIHILTSDEYWDSTAANCSYVDVEVGPGKKYESLGDLEAWVAEQNSERREGVANA